jgi:molybdopterin-guanine dinucleotide biosynthesis protein A
VDRAGYGAVVLAGGAGSRLGDARKPTLTVAGRPMLDRVLNAVADAVTRVVVGPPDLRVPAGVLLTREVPAGGGPVAAAAAGLAAIPVDLPHLALLAADLPLLDRPAVAVLRSSLADADAAVYVDAGGHRQLLCGVWHAAALRRALADLADERGALEGAAMRGLVGRVRVAEVSWTGAGPPPWFDCDTDADLRQAEEWAR